MEDLPRGGTGVDPCRVVRRHLSGEWVPFNALCYVMDESQLVSNGCPGRYCCYGNWEGTQ